MLFSIVACDGGNNNDIPSTSDKENNSVENPPDEEVPFYAGYARADITPTQFPIKLQMGTEATKVLNPIYASCVAFYDGETKALFVSIDTLSVPQAFYEQVVTEIVKNIDVPKSNIFICATHNHSAPKLNEEKVIASLVKWKRIMSEAIGKAAKEAFDDLALTEAYMGTADTTGLAFVRRYLLADGTYQSVNSNNPSTADEVAHETEADPEMQIIRFVREGDKKDIVIANWQAHAAHAYGENQRAISGDFVYWMRKGIEEENDVHFAYFQGGAGNINLHSYVNNVTGRYVKVGKELAKRCNEALGGLEKIKLGKISSATSDCKVQIFDDGEELSQAALDILEGRNKVELMKKYDITINEAGSIWTRHKFLMDNPSGYVELPLFAISFGDVSFVSAPYEMFDTDAMAVKDASPFKTAFVCAYTNGHYGYIPSDLAYPHGDYEVYKSYFVEGTGGILSGKMIEMLKSLK